MWLKQFEQASAFRFCFSERSEYHRTSCIVGQHRETSVLRFTGQGHEPSGESFFQTCSRKSLRSDDSKNWHCDIDITQTLQDSPADVKRLVTPILHYSITMNVLIGFLEKAFRYCI